MLFVGLFIAVFSCLYAAPLSVKVAAEAAILMNPDTGKILYAKEPYTEHYPASITKIATALWALKTKGDHLDDLVVASGDSVASVTEEAKRRANYTTPAWWLVPGVAHIGIKKGEVLSLRDLLFAMMVTSAGDASNVIAEYVGPGIPTFMEGLNDYVQSLGCKNTHFENPHGLFHPKQKTCAYDMALIMRAALQEPMFRTLIGTVTYNRPKTDKQSASVLIQSNRLMRPGPFYYPKAIGGKTGYLALARNTFVVAAKEGDRTLIAVLLKANERTDLWRDAIKLFETAFNQPAVERLYLKGGVQKYSIQEDAFDTPLTTYTAEDAKLTYYPAEEPVVKGLLYWDELLPPIAKGRRVGEVRLVDEQGRTLKAVPLLAANDVGATFAFTLKQFFTKGPFYLLLLKYFLLVSLFGALLWLWLTRKQMK